jgi:hypothetical protein
MARVDHLAGGIYRLSTCVPAKRISFNQLLIQDEKPALIRTGAFPMYDHIRLLRRSSILLACATSSSLTSRQTNAADRFVTEAAQAVLACGAVGWRINLQQSDYTGPVQGVQDGDVLDLGQHRLRFWETPHVHHWDSMMVVEDTTGSLFPSDLFIQPGDQPPVVQEDLGADMCRWYRSAGLFGRAEPVQRVADRVERLAPDWVHPKPRSRLYASPRPPFSPLDANGSRYGSSYSGFRPPPIRQCYLS